MIKPLFLCHGGPTLVIENNSYTDFLKEYGRNHTPKAIIVFTAHWENNVTQISSIEGKYNMIYDFYGFPKELYSIEYPANGSPELAARISSMLEKNNIPSKLDTNRGLDHGAWDILYLMYPKADIPVVQMSIDPFLEKEKIIEIGKVISELSKEDILIIGSGSTVHNLGTLESENSSPTSWAVEFDDWLINAILLNQTEQLIDYRFHAPHARMAVPREEHLVPLFIAKGSGNQNPPKLLHRSYIFGTLSYIALEF